MPPTTKTQSSWELTIQLRLHSLIWASQQTSETGINMIYPFPKVRNQGAEAKSLGHTQQRAADWESISDLQISNHGPFLPWHGLFMEPTLWICSIPVAFLNSCILLRAQREKAASAAVRRPRGIQFPSPKADLLCDTPDRNLGNSPEELKFSLWKYWGPTGIVGKIISSHIEQNMRRM